VYSGLQLFPIVKQGWQRSEWCPHIFPGLSALWRKHNDSGPLQNAAEVDAPEITELEGNLAYDEPDQTSGNTKQRDNGPSLCKHGKS
jgi:hypothetical protein